MQSKDGIQRIRIDKACGQIDAAIIGPYTPEYINGVQLEKKRPYLLNSLSGSKVMNFWRVLSSVALIVSRLFQGELVFVHSSIA
jgi:hypothetical protein